MNNYFKYIKAGLYVLIPLFLGTIIISILYYNNIISNSLNSYIPLGILLISLLLSGIYLGNKVNQKGYFEGIKLGLGTILIFIIFSLIFKQKLGINSFIYYIVILTISIIGSIIGINKKKKR